MSSINNIPDAISLVKSEITGAFRGEPIAVEYYEVPKSNKLVVNIHGTFGEMHWSTGKYSDFARSIVEQELASTVLYSSSRDWKKARELDKSYESKIATFQGKTFSDELEDARRVVREVISQAKKNLPEWEILEVTLHGNSLGGILAFYLAQEFSEISGIISVWTGLRTERWSVPILDTIPNVEELRKILWMYVGKFIMQYWTLDDTFSEEAFQTFYEAVWTQQKSSIEYTWVDHWFKTINGEASEKVFQTVTHQLIQYLETAELSGGSISLETPSEGIKLQRKYADLTKRLVAHAGEGFRVSLEDQGDF